MIAALTQRQDIAINNKTLFHFILQKPGWSWNESLVINKSRRFHLEKRLTKPT